MREILFRGKRLDNGEWVYGMLCQYHERISAKIVCNAFGAYEAETAFCVSPATVGQYIGLTDKNDVNIFEGDIIKLPVFDDEKCLFEVKFGGVKNVLCDVGCIGFYLSPINASAKKYNSFGLRDDILYWVDNEFKISVIGNIHDDPELLKTRCTSST